MATDPTTTNTVQKYISAQTNEEISYESLSFIEHLEKLDLPIKNVVEDYLEDIEDAYIDIELTDEDYRKYKYKPKVLCYDVYGAPELYFIIMRMNGIYSMKDFTKRKLKMLKPAAMTTLVRSIYTAEKNIIDTYNLK